MTTPTKTTASGRIQLPAAPCLLSILTLLAVATEGFAADNAQLPEAPPPVSARFGENLKPTKAAPAIKNQPYAPIKKLDDQGNIPEIEMFVGESRVFPAPGVARIAVGNGQILTAASLDNKEIIVFANAVGTSSLFVWNEDGRYQRIKINILPGDTSRYAREIAAFLSGIPNAKASVIGDKVIVEGDNLSDQDMAKIDELAKRYPQVVNFTNRIGWEKMVLLDVKVVEFPVNELKEMGLKWTSTGGVAVGAIWSPITHGNNLADYQINLKTGSNNAAPIVAAAGGASIPLHAGINALSVVNMGLNAQLALLAQNGTASILAEPQLSARNGSEAFFLAGGEYPYTVSTINGPTVMFKPYGIRLKIAPKVDRHGIVRATIDSEVSSIDPSLSTAAGPALLTRKTNTEFNVRNGETLILAGLLSRKTSNNIDKVPFLGDIPILGALFRSKRFQNDETELVVFVTPTVVDSHTPELVDRIDRTRQKLQDNLGKAPYLSTPIQPGQDASQFTEGPTSSGKRQAQPPTPTIERAPIEPAPIMPVPAAASQQTTNTVPAGENPLQTSKRESFRVLVDGIALRESPDRNATIMVQLGRDSIVSAGPKGRSGKWRHVMIGSIGGWVGQKNLETTDDSPVVKTYRRPNASALNDGNAPAPAENPGTSPVTANPSNLGNPAYRVAFDGLALRVAPDINAALLQRLPFNSVVEALPQPLRFGWAAVQVGDRRGWAQAQWLAPAEAE